MFRGFFIPGIVRQSQSMCVQVFLVVLAAMPGALVVVKLAQQLQRTGPPCLPW